MNRRIACPTAIFIIFLVCIYPHESSAQPKSDAIQMTPAEEAELVRRPIKVLPSPVVLPNVKQVLSSKVGDVTVELLSGTVDRLKFNRNTVKGLRELDAGRVLIIKLRIVNQSLDPLAYKPWYFQEKDLSKAGDEESRTYAIWRAGVASWPVGANPKQKQSIDREKTHHDIIALEAPHALAEEISISLDSIALGRKGQFKFVIARKFFEDETTRIAAATKAAEKKAADEEDRLNKLEDIRIEQARTRIKSRLDAVALERRLEAERKEAERLAAEILSKKALDPPMEVVVPVPGEMKLPDVAPTPPIPDEEKKAAAAAAGAFLGGFTMCAVFGFILLGLFALVIEMLPVIIAMYRGHPDTLAIFLVTFFFSWTGIAWFIAIIWAVKSFPRNQDGNARDY